jgi:type II secretory pathway component PulM
MNRWLSLIHERLQQLSARDRRALWLGSSAMLVVLVMGSALTLQERSAAVALRLQQKQALLATLPATLDRLQRRERLGEEATLPLGTLARRLLERSALSADVQPGTDGSIELRLVDVPFDATLELIAEFDAQAIALRQARIDPANEVGRVNARFELGPRPSRAP